MAVFVECANYARLSVVAWMRMELVKVVRIRFEERGLKCPLDEPTGGA